MYLHQIEGVEFIYNSHGQTLPSTLYMCKPDGTPNVGRFVRY